MDDLLDFGDAAEVYADGIAAVDIVGNIAVMYFFVWRKIDGRYRKKLCFVMRRPVASLGEGITLKLAAQGRTADIETMAPQH